MKRATFVSLGLAVTALAIGGIYAAGMPNERECEEATERFAATEFWPITLDMWEIEHRLGLDQHDALLMELWERRTAQSEREEQIRALRADHEQETTQREEQYAKQDRATLIEQRRAELAMTRLRVAQEGETAGVTALPADEARKTLRSLAGQVFVTKVERTRAKEALQQQHAASLHTLTAQVDALRAEQQQLEQEIIEKSRELFMREMDQACSWFGR